MASIKIEAQDVLDIARDGIGWIAVWKKGRSWETTVFWPDIQRDGTLVFEDDDIEELREINSVDPCAILVNSWYHNLGDTTCMTRDTLADALRWQYGLQNSLVVQYLVLQEFAG